jgi:hypothetical protein
MGDLAGGITIAKDQPNIREELLSDVAPRSDDPDFTRMRLDKSGSVTDCEAITVLCEYFILSDLTPTM